MGIFGRGLSFTKPTDDDKGETSFHSGANNQSNHQFHIKLLKGNYRKMTAMLIISGVHNFQGYAFLVYMHDHMLVDFV